MPSFAVERDLLRPLASEGFEPGLTLTPRVGPQVLHLGHYLEVLKFKPGALAGATALVQARASGSFNDRGVLGGRRRRNRFRQPGMSEMGWCWWAPLG